MPGGAPEVSGGPVVAGPPVQNLLRGVMPSDMPASPR